MRCSSHHLQMCEKDAVIPDVSCTAGHQSTTIASGSIQRDVRLPL